LKPYFAENLRNNVQPKISQLLSYLGGIWYKDMDLKSLRFVEFCENRELISQYHYPESKGSKLIEKRLLKVRNVFRI
jgi:hypothetical protein